MSTTLTPDAVEKAATTIVAQAINGKNWHYGIAALPGPCAYDYCVNTDLVGISASIRLFGPEHENSAGNLERKEFARCAERIYLDCDDTRDLTTLTPYLEALARVAVRRADREALKFANRGADADD